MLEDLSIQLIAERMRPLDSAVIYLIIIICSCKLTTRYIYECLTNTWMGTKQNYLPYYLKIFGYSKGLNQMATNVLIFLLGTFFKNPFLCLLNVY